MPPIFNIIFSVYSLENILVWWETNKYMNMVKEYVSALHWRTHEILGVGVCSLHHDPIRVPQNHSICYPQVLSYSCDPHFVTKFLHCLVWSSLNLDTPQKHLRKCWEGVGALCIPKAFVYILLSLDLRPSDKMHERERTQKLHHVLCYWIYFVGSGVPRSSKRGMDQLNRLQSISARSSYPSARVSIY